MRGTLEAQSFDHANELIAARGLALLRIEEKASTSAKSLSRWVEKFNKIHPEELIIYTKQLSTMMRAGIPLLRSFDILESQTENPRLKTISSEIASDIRAGSNLNRALRRHPDAFSPLYCSMVMAGESSGALPQVMDRLIYIISHEHKVKSDIRSVLQYPLLVLLCLGTAFVVLVTMVIPRFAAVYVRSGIVLPLPTRICLALSNLFRHEWPWLVAGAAMLAIAYVLFTSTRGGRQVRDRVFLGIPLMGPLMVKAALSRFASIFSILQASGVGILDSLQMLSDTIGNRAIGHELEGVQVKLEEGHGIARPLMAARYFTPMFINMVAIGEEAGNLDHMLKEIAAHYDAEVEFATRRLTTAMGPILIVALAALVGFFALAVYLPMWDLARLVTRG